MRRVGKGGAGEETVWVSPDRRPWIAEALLFLLRLIAGLPHEMKQLLKQGREMVGHVATVLGNGCGV